jgi:hypothetical protein
VPVGALGRSRRPVVTRTRVPCPVVLECIGEKKSTKFVLPSVTTPITPTGLVTRALVTIDMLRPQSRRVVPCDRGKGGNSREMGTKREGGGDQARQGRTELSRRRKRKGARVSDPLTPSQLASTFSALLKEYVHAGYPLCRLRCRERRAIYLQRPVSTAAAAQLLKFGIWVMNWTGPLPVRK